MKSCIIRTLVSIGSCLIASGVMAADIRSPMTPAVQETTTESGWTFSFAPYFWAAGLSGDVAQFGLPEAHVDASFSDIFDHLDFGAMAIGLAIVAVLMIWRWTRRERLGLTQLSH